MTDAASGREPEQPEHTNEAAAAEQQGALETPAVDAAAHPEPQAQTPTAEAQAHAPEAPKPAASATPAASEPSAPEPVPALRPAAQPTGTLYAPGQAPQPYRAAAYEHQQAPAPQPASAHASASTGAGAPPVPPAFGGGQAQATQPTQPIGPAGQAPQKPKSRLGVGIAAGLVVGALIGGGSAAGVTALIQANSDSPAPASVSSPQNIVVNDTRNVNEITGVAAKAGPSVVTISVAGNEGAGTGSGVILSEDGYVLTNTHVVTLDGATGDPTIQVKDSAGRLYTAELVGTDPLSDLAVIKLADAKGLEPIEFADSSKLNVGDAAIAIGAPLDLANTVTNGIVSALNRSISVASSAAPEQSDEQSDEGQQGGQNPFDFWNYPGQENEAPQQQANQGQISIPVVQTDAAINPGNSGGALLDADGKLIGINVAILGAGGSEAQAGNIGLGFAVPSNLAERVAKELIEDGTASHGLLGATVGAAAAAEGASMTGALINDVTPGGAAAEAGLEVGDVVTTFDGLPITDQTDLTAQVRALPGGAKAEVGFVRDGQTHTVEVTLGELES
ncbi:S1C family serine protease [Agromyces archimandritae]|uniref:Trypsin-like peptidase domain-containing protein n=1 Tax=Agromyces archimandritae TaxID=2781962 RepID=A0A975IPS3_9MICO|nr:trypsin-like peptidase domain-containing protein [Agromyces archimandritae]QTX04296.1 trypsin-like peptidase domain-containing protein [Agromyces archimandritae]